MAKKAKKLNSLSPVQRLELLRSMIKEGQRFQHKAQQIISTMNLDIPMDSEKADHAILGYMAKGNKHWQ